MELIAFVLLALFQPGIVASPFPTLKPGQNDGVSQAPTPANGSTDNTTSMRASSTTPWLPCLNQATSMDCYNNDYTNYTNCTDDWMVQPRNPACVEKCWCDNADEALQSAQNTSARHVPINLAKAPLSIAVSDVKEMMASYEKRQRDTVNSSVVEHRIISNYPSIHDNKVDPNSTCTLTCVSNEITAMCSKFPAQACGLDKGFSGTEDYTDKSFAPPQSAQHDRDVTPDTYTRLGTEIHKPLLEASLGFTVIPVDQELVAADGRLHRPPTSLDQVPAHSPGLNITINGPYSEDISKIIGLPFLAARDSLPQPGRVKERHTPETATVESDLEEDIASTEAPKMDPEPSDTIDGYSVAK
ncbi:hypothetical protein VMCG_10009 [Cytospora schulzeri]|uniref:Extracellular membrane protein CFEM domain-containing protein n=1 Tax=Cytospora schulzeri TaxID=448051 RepID=A0A423VIA6_9PEZI|nr:hypothetical protein VMCG_10009 [Valsa malicola]